MEDVSSRPSKRAGRPPIGTERMLRMSLVQVGFKLSDESTEKANYDSLAVRDFHLHGPCSLGLRRIPGYGDETLCHVDGDTADTLAEPDAGAVIHGADRLRAAQQLRRILRQQLPIHDETASTPDHARFAATACPFPRNFCQLSPVQR